LQLASKRRAYHQNKQEKFMAEFTLRIDGMHCGSCVRRVTQALNSAGNVEVEEVRIGAARLKSPDVNPPVDAAIAALAKAGYSARLEQ
jgi:copper chaperone